ncbi:MAG: dihydrolipoyl dehydrogenase, partial [Spirochaetales bacterium]
GPAGYFGAERLAHRGKKVLLIEKESIGGTCLNVGCIPTKTLLHSAKHYLHAKESAQFGVYCENPSFNFAEMMSRKEKTVKTLCTGVNSMLKKLNVEIISGTGQLIDGNRVKIAESGEIYEARAILLATGSVPVMPAIPGAENNPRVLDSTALLNIENLPQSLCIIGGGVIGIEFASLFSTLGSTVSVIEMLDEIIPPMDKDHAPLLRKALSGVDFYTGCTVRKIEQGSDADTIYFTAKDGTDKFVHADIVLSAVGRRAYIDSSLASDIGIDIGSKGITADEHMRTNISGIWAVGDVNGQSMLAHSAYRMAEVAVNAICAYLEGEKSCDIMRYNAVPWVVYSIPEAAGCGLTEQEAIAQGIEIQTAAVPMQLSGRFIAENGLRAVGNVKIIATKQEGRILGVHIVGPYASEIIWGAGALIENELRVQDVKEMIFAHPTVSEVIREAIWTM